MPSGWPSSIKGDNGFHRLGEAIAREPGFPKYGSDVQKARYVYLRLPEIQNTYRLRASYSVEGLSILYHRWTGKDPEAADALKNSGVGHCGEFAYAFSQILAGAGIVNVPVYADKSKEPGYSFTHGGTDTTVIVYEDTPDRKRSRRVFDAFRAAWEGSWGHPTPSSLSDWGDLPLTDDDKLPRDFKSHKMSWLKKVVKSYVKHASFETLLQDLPPRRNPSYRFFGKWYVSQVTQYMMDLKQSNKSVSGIIYAKRGKEIIKAGEIKGAVVSQDGLSFSGKWHWNYDKAKRPPGAQEWQSTDDLHLVLKPTKNPKRIIISGVRIDGPHHRNIHGSNIRPDSWP